MGPNRNGLVGNSSNRLAVVSVLKLTYSLGDSHVPRVEEVKSESAQFFITIDRG